MFCLLDQERYLRPSRVRLQSSGILYEVNGETRYVQDMNFFEGDRLLKCNDHSNLVEKKAKKLNESVTRVFQDKDREPDYY